MMFVRSAFHLGQQPPIDRWLRLAPGVQKRYDDENARTRIGELRSAILVGLALYNVYNVTSIVLLPDVFLLSTILRLGVITPTSLGLAWLIGRTDPRWTERLVTAGVLNAYLVPVFLFWFSSEPFGLFTFGELPLTIIFANMLLALRFSDAVLFTLGALSATLLAVALKAGLDPSLRFAFMVQFATACLFALYANYRQERRRCLDFLTALEAKLEAQSAHADRQTFQDLSRTDVLTQLPNRRHLTERLEKWLSEQGSMAVMMIDIDHFKLFNDTLGHQAGDDCLQHVAAALARVAAEADDAFCARFGGEEFTFALRCAGEFEAARCARDLVQAVAALQIPHPARSDGLGIVTISIGVTHVFNDGRRELRTIMTAADRALYAAKQNGRNRFVLSTERDTITVAAS